jgi:hypothetical protein
VGRNPLTPVNDAGWRIDPPVSVPVAAGASAAAIASARRSLCCSRCR